MVNFLKAVIPAVIVGTGVYLVTKPKDEENQVSKSYTGAGSGSFAGELEQPNYTYIINEGDINIPEMSGSVPIGSTPTKKDTKTTYTTKSGSKINPLVKQASTSASRFAKSSAGGYVDTYKQQSISESEKDSRNKKSLFSAAPQSILAAPTKKEEKKEAPKSSVFSQPMSVA